MNVPFTRLSLTETAHLCVVSADLSCEDAAARYGHNHDALVAEIIRQICERNMAAWDAARNGRARK